MGFSSWGHKEFGTTERLTLTLNNSKMTDTLNELTSTRP